LLQYFDYYSEELVLLFFLVNVVLKNLVYLKKL